MNLVNKKFKFFSIFVVFFFISEKNLYSEFIVNLIGDWEGLNKSYSMEKGYRTWNKKITIFEHGTQVSEPLDPSRSTRLIESFRSHVVSSKTASDSES